MNVFFLTDSNYDDVVLSSTFAINMPSRERRPCVLNAPSWRSKRLLREDENVQDFSWPYDTGALIDEMQHISEIAELYEKVQQPTDVTGYFVVPMQFEDTFIDSHEFLVQLIDRATISWNTSAQEQIILVHLGNGMDNEVTYYKNANTIFKYTRERLLRMRCLYEQLRPETQNLVHRCSNFMQIENSMLAQKKAPVRLSDNMCASAALNFQPPCGFRLETKTRLEKPTAITHDLINDLELQMTRLQMQKDILQQNLNDKDKLQDASETCDRLRIILCNGQCIIDPMEALEYAHDALAPQKQLLERHSTLFENTLHLFPESFPETFPSTCTADDVLAFYQNMLHALEEDNAQIALLRSKI